MALSTKDNKEENKNPIENVFVARQPIFTADRQVFGYELLFRSGFKNYCDNLDDNYTTSKVLSNSFLVLGVESITGGKKAFINFPRKLLLDDVATSFSNKIMGIEILETVDPEDDIIAACKRLKEGGYTLALDDFVLEEKFRPLIELADIIKIDFMATPPELRGDIIQMINRPNIKYLAEKVETYEDYQQGLDLGYSYFQGYFFSKPVILTGKDIPGYKVTYLQILQEVSSEHADFSHLEQVIKQDVSLTYKLLRYINSALYGFNDKIQNLKHALIMLGIDEIRKWMALIIMSDLGKDKPAELIISSIIRAKFCESLAQHIGKPHMACDLFLLGMFSMIDAFFDRPLEEILDELPINSDIKHALQGEENIFRDMYELIVAYEKGLWKVADHFTEKLNITDGKVPIIFSDSVKWATTIFRMF